jgi:myo-inositol-1(or 4)-monophosphatase
MKNIQSEVVLELTKKLRNIFGPDAAGNLKVDTKADKSFVTEIDLFVSELIKNKLMTHSRFKHFNFYSEEEFTKLEFPTAILDPIDGTRELVMQRAECAVSLAMMNSPHIYDPENYAWIYNPFTGFSIDSSAEFINVTNKSSKKILGLVSRSEFEKGHFDKFAKEGAKIDLSPRGSIAFKLGLLAAGGCDFVVSLSPKNIWDIAAGTILCAQRGFYLYQNGVRVENLNEVHLSGTLIWTPDSLLEDLNHLFHK